MTTLLYIGNFKQGHSTENHYALSFEQLDCTVHRLQEQDAAEDPDRILKRALALKVDLVLYTRTPPGLPSDWVTGIWGILEDEGIKTASVHLDLFWGIHREQLIYDADPLFTTGTVFTADGDHDEDWANAGVNHRWLRAGVLRDECYRGKLLGRARNHDLAFVGSGTSSGRGYHPEWKHRANLLRHLERFYGRRYVRYGDTRQTTVRGPALNGVYRSVPIIVGDTLSLRGRQSKFWSDRVYETWGRGGFLLHPRIDALEAELDVGMPGYEFGDFEQLDAQVEYWLANPVEREEYRQVMQQHVRAHCTYTNRAAEILHELDLTNDTKEHQA